MEKKIWRIGSRDSMLAVAQTRLVMDQLSKAFPDVELRLITMKTTGDRILDRSLDQIGGKGLFVKELDRALLDGRIDLAVHSLKDLPMEGNEELPVAAMIKRGDPRDALVLPGSGMAPEETCVGTVPAENQADIQIDVSADIQEKVSADIPVAAFRLVGTSSVRRSLQLKAMAEARGVLFEGRSIRGNVISRLEKLDRGDYSALVLAAAGLSRLNISSRVSRYFTTEEMIPAAGQGILAIQARRDFDVDCLKAVDDEDTHIAALAERSFVRALDGGCTSPAAAFAQVSGSELVISGLYYSECTGRYKTGRLVGDIRRPELFGERLAYRLRQECEGKKTF